MIKFLFGAFAKRSILLFGLCCIITSCYAQVKPIYFIGDELTTDSTRATSYAIYGKLSTDELWLIKRYDLYNNLLITGSYKDGQLKIPHGQFNYYHNVDRFNNENDTYFYFKDRDRFLSRTGSFINGMQNGEWLTFYPDGKVFTSYVFINNVLNGAHTKYDRKGNIEVKGNYVEGKKDGVWLFYGGLQKNVYQLDSLLSVVKDKKLVRREFTNPGFN